MTDTVPSDFDLFPGVLREIAEAAGQVAAVKVADAVGGRRAYFPAEPKEGHWLVDLVGMERARAICAQLAPGDRGVELEVPLGPVGDRFKKHRRLRALIDRGLSKPEIVRLTGLHPKTIQRHKNGHCGSPKTDPDQGELF